MEGQPKLIMEIIIPFQLSSNNTLPVERTNTHYPSKLGLPHILKPSTTVMSENTC